MDPLTIASSLRPQHPILNNGVPQTFEEFNEAAKRANFGRLLTEMYRGYRHAGSDVGLLAPPGVNPLQGADPVDYFAGFAGTTKVPRAQRGFIAYHSSPHDFDKFSMDHIGRGEGAQVYGHGLYVAQNPKVSGARGVYRKQFEPSAEALHHMRLDKDTAYWASNLAKNWGGRDKAAAFLAKRTAGEHTARDLAALEYLKSDAPLLKINKTAKTYKVRVKAHPDEFLDWDAPLSEQGAKVKDAVARHMVEQSGMTPKNEGFSETVKTVRKQLDTSEMTGAQAYKTQWGDPAKATERLRGSSIPGIKYLDGMSRKMGKGTRNFVLFDDKMIEILKKYGVVPPGLALAASLLGGNEAEAAQ